MRGLVLKIVDMARACEAERAAESEGKPTARAVGDIAADMMRRLTETGSIHGPAARALRGSLSALPYEDLVDIAKVMLIGRDGAMTAAFEPDGDGARSRLVGYIADKSPLADYLLAGLAALDAKWSTREEPSCLQ